MLKLRDAYGNSSSSGFTIDFFELNAPEARSARLASPFFSTIEPISVLTKRGCEVQLLVRLCPITPPSVLKEALKNPLVSIRYYTSRSFHAKLYLIDDKALVGSANLTNSGLKTNREVSVVLQKDRDAGFGDLGSLFSVFWEYADVYTVEVHQAYELAYRNIGNPLEEEAFQKKLEEFVPHVAPPSTKVGSYKVSQKRSFIQKLRRKYDEQLIPAFREVQELFAATGIRRPEYEGTDSEIELSRFLGWARVVHAPAETWSTGPLRDREGRAKQIGAIMQMWISTADTQAGDLFYADAEVANIERIRDSFSSESKIRSLSYDEIFDTLSGCHAFYEMLRFVSGGLPGLKADFARRNTLEEIRSTLSYLLHGPGASLERAYDCIFSEEWKLGRFGESCVMELLGWMDPTRPPINGRTVKALRFFGFDVHE